MPRRPPTDERPRAATEVPGRARAAPVHAGLSSIGPPRDPLGMDPRPPATSHPEAVPPDALVAHAGFVRGLAYAILRDDADADDATQEALVVGLASGPRDPAAARGWLAAVVRNVAYRFRRREARSETRERRASRAEAASATVDLVTREETLRSVVDAVGALDPASREVILLRHYEDLPPRVIAARLNLPVETVKKRLVRAHATLRARLDAGEGASRRRHALAAFAGLPLGSREGTAAVAAGGGVAMASGTKAAALAAAALLVVGGSVWVVAARDGGGGADPKAPSALGDGGTVADAGSPAPVEVPLAASVREPRSPARAAVAAKPRTLPKGWSRHTWGTLSFALPDTWDTDKGHNREMQTWSAPGADGQRVAGVGLVRGTAAAALRAQLPAERTTRPLVVMGEAATWTEVTNGENVAVIVSFDAPTPTTPGVHFIAQAPAALWKDHARVFEEVLSWLELAPTPPGPAPTSDGEPDDLLVASWGGIVLGDRVEGRVVRGTRGLPGATVKLVQASIVVEGFELGAVVHETTTAADGAFAWSGLEPRAWAVVVAAPGAVERRAFVQTHAPPTMTSRVVVVLGTSTIEGRAFARDGTPAGGRNLLLVEQRPRGSATLVRVGLDAQGRFRASGLTAGYWALRLDLDDDPNGDHRDTVVETEARKTVTVTLGSETPEPVWTGSVRLASGTPLHDAVARLHVSSMTRTESPTFVGVRTDARGAFTQRLPRGTYHVALAGVPHVSRFTFDVEIGPGGLARDVIVPGVLVAGTLVDGDTRRPFPPARPGAGAAICIRRPDEPASPTALGFPPDEHGTFRLFGVPPGRYVVYARPAPGDDREGSSVEIVVPADRDVTDLALDIHAR